MKVFVLLLRYVIELLISILAEFVASHKIVFYSKLYDIDFLANFTHDRTYITLYVHEIVLSLQQHCFLDNKVPRTTLICKIWPNTPIISCGRTILTMAGSRPLHSHVKHKTYECSPSEKPTPIPLILMLKNNPFSCIAQTFSL